MGGVLPWRKGRAPRVVVTGRQILEGSPISLGGCLVDHPREIRVARDPCVEVDDRLGLQAAVDRCHSDEPGSVGVGGRVSGSGTEAGQHASADRFNNAQQSAANRGRSAGELAAGVEHKHAEPHARSRARLLSAPPSVKATLCKHERLSEPFTLSSLKPRVPQLALALR
eukprot:7237560-Prymnesium_polylepis.3